jgi:hypothetical protein
MAIFSGPEIPNNGLVFHYDMSNQQKSWRGATTTNLHPMSGYLTWPTQTLHFWNGNSWVVNGTYTDPGVPGPAGIYLGEVRKYTSGALSATWSGNSYAYMLKTAPMTLGQSYAMSAYTYLSTDCNIDGMNSSIEGASVSALSGGYSTTYNMSQKGSWQRQGLQGTGSGNVNFIVAYPYKNGVTNGAFTGSILVGGAMVEFGTFPTPYTDNSRSNTQAILDLTNNNVVTASSLTYASDGTFSFNGSSNLAVMPNNTALDTNNPSIEVWVKPTTLNHNGFWFEKGTVNSQYSLFQEGTNICFRSNPSVTFTSLYGSSSVLSTTNWNHVVGVKSATEKIIYVNGVRTYALADTDSVATTTGGMSIGVYGGFNGSRGYWYSGSLRTVKVYNRALSAVEVQQNFEAARGRYGI